MWEMISTSCIWKAWKHFSVRESFGDYSILYSFFVFPYFWNVTVNYLMDMDELGLTECVLSAFSVSARLLWVAFFDLTSFQQCVKQFARFISFLECHLSQSYSPAWSIMVLLYSFIRISFKLDACSQHESLLSVLQCLFVLSPCLLPCTAFLVTCFSLYFLKFIWLSGLSASMGPRVQPQ